MKNKIKAKLWCAMQTYPDGDSPIIIYRPTREAIRTFIRGMSADFAQSKIFKLELDLRHDKTVGNMERQPLVKQEVE